MSRESNHMIQHVTSLGRCRICVEQLPRTPRHAPPTAPLTPEQPPADHGDGSGAGGRSGGEGV